jgi:hypothetical protein
MAGATLGTAEQVGMNSGEIDPQYSDLHHEISTTGGPNQGYSVKSGDNLSKISNRFYGSPNPYSNIAAGSNISDPNKIQAGQQITDLRSTSHNSCRLCTCAAGSAHGRQRIPLLRLLCVVRLWRSPESRSDSA